MRPWRSGEEILKERLGRPPAPGAPRPARPPRPAAPPPRQYVAAKLAQLRLLDDVPFAHMVPDAALLPPESLRFFALDGAWTDALVAGAQAVGISSAAELAHHEATRAAGLAASDAH